MTRERGDSAFEVCASRDNSREALAKGPALLFHGSEIPLVGELRGASGWLWFSEDAVWAAQYGAYVYGFARSDLRLAHLSRDVQKARSQLESLGISTEGFDWRVQESYRAFSDLRFGHVLAARVEAVALDGFEHFDNRYVEGTGVAIMLTNAAVAAKLVNAANLQAMRGAGRMKTLERRAIPVEVRAARSNPRRLDGYAATFGAETRIGDFVETIRPGAFAASLASGRDILALADHDPQRVLGRTKSGTLRLSEDTRGLAFAIDLPDTQAARDMLALAERGDLGGMSFGFNVETGGDAWNGNCRELRAVTLHEISVVSAWPAYEGTIVEPRAARQRGPVTRNLARRYLETLRGRL